MAALLDWIGWNANAPAVPVAVLLAMLIAGIARWNKSLRANGAVAATVIGSLALAAGWRWGFFLVAWFGLNSLASRFGRTSKARRTAGVVAKGGNRDATQVVANGGIFAVAALWSLVTSSVDGHETWWGAAALVAAGADTMATEIGTWLGGTPRSVRTGRPVAPGTSGAVSVVGSIAMCGAAVSLAWLAVVIGPVHPSAGAVVAIAGLSGAVVDTLVGAFVQERRWCQTCSQHTEQRTHSCGTSTQHTSGWQWLGNDHVNLLCTGSAAAVAMLLPVRLSLPHS